MRSHVGAWSFPEATRGSARRASFLPGHHGAWCAPPHQLAACSSIPARVPVGTLPPVSSEDVRPRGSTWRGSGARIQTNSRTCRRSHRLLGAQSAGALGGGERPLSAAGGGAWLARWPALRSALSGAAEWTSADRTTPVETGKPCVHPSCPLQGPRVGRRPRCRVHAAQRLSGTQLCPVRRSVPSGTSDSYSVTILGS